MTACIAGNVTAAPTTIGALRGGCRMEPTPCTNDDLSGNVLWSRSAETEMRFDSPVLELRSCPLLLLFGVVMDLFQRQGRGYLGLLCVAARSVGSVINWVFPVAAIAL